MPESLANDPDLLWCEGHFVAVGRGGIIVA